MRVGAFGLLLTQVTRRTQKSAVLIIFALELVFFLSVCVWGAESEARGVWLTLSLFRNKMVHSEIVKTLKRHNLNMVLLYYQPGEETKEFINLCGENHIEVQFWVTPRLLIPGPKREWKCTGYHYRQQKFVKMTPMYFNPDYQAEALSSIERMISEYGVDGIHLDGVRFGLPWDNLGPESLEQFQKDTGIRIEKFPDDIIRVSNIKTENIGSPSAWAGRYLREWANWRARVVADFFATVRKYLREHHPGLVLTNACMTDYSSKLYYGVDYSLLSPHLDCLIPMVYYNRYGRTPEWAIKRAREIAIVARASNPDCHIYAGISSYSHSRCRIWISNTVRKLLKEGKLSRQTVARERLLRYITGAQMMRIAKWLHGRKLISDKLFHSMDNSIITVDEVARAIELMREPPPTDLGEARTREYIDQARIEGVVFMRLYCMFQENSESVVGDLFARLKHLFPTPATLPHRQSH